MSGGNAGMVDWVELDVAMLDREMREELHSLLLFRKADRFNHGRFSNWDYPDVKIKFSMIWLTSP